jgi:hypothetical protein
LNDHDFDELLSRSKQVARVLTLVYRDLTGEDLDLESAVRHHPLVMLGTAVGLGFLAGYWVTGRAHQELPPPPKPYRQDPFQQLLPESLEQVRSFLPEWNAREVEAQAREWIERVVDPRVREGVESTKLGAFLRRTIERLGSDDEERGDLADEA